MERVGERYNRFYHDVSSSGGLVFRWSGYNCPENAEGGASGRVRQQRVARRIARMTLRAAVKAGALSSMEHGYYRVVVGLLVEEPVHQAGEPQIQSELGCGISATCRATVVAGVRSTLS